MEEKDFEARLLKLSSDIEQLSAKIDDEIASLKEEFNKQIVKALIALKRDASLNYLLTRQIADPSLSEACARAHKEIAKLALKYIKEGVEEDSKVSAEEFQKRYQDFAHDVDRITRSAGLGEIWKRPED